MTIDPKDFRRVLGSFGSGITVVAVEVEDAVHGMTVSAFLSVSIDPPLILVSIGQAAHLHPRILRRGAFTVSILAAEQVDVSNRFARRIDPGAVVTWDRTPLGNPVLPGALGWIDCTLDNMVDAGDHTLFVGRVLALDARDGDGLVYFRGRYQHMTPV
jgi:flavin reductase (DIM6/NTAB) family NADH-FMN oxidoreductase RutF